MIYFSRWQRASLQRYAERSRITGLLLCSAGSSAAKIRSDETAEIEDVDKDCEVLEENLIHGMVM